MQIESRGGQQIAVSFREPIEHLYAGRLGKMFTFVAYVPDLTAIEHAHPAVLDWVISDTRMGEHSHPAVIVNMPDNLDRVFTDDYFAVIAHMLQRATDRVQIAHAVIDYGNPLPCQLQAPLGGGYRAGECRVGAQRHAQCPAKGLEHGLGLVVRIGTTQVVHVKRSGSVVDEALEELLEQVYVEIADAGTHKVDAKLQARASGQVDHNPRQGLVQGYVSMAVTQQTRLVAHGLCQGLAQGDADVFDRVVCIDVQVTLCRDT